MSVIIGDGLRLPHMSLDGIRLSQNDVRDYLRASKECRESRTKPGRPADFDRCGCCRVAVALLKNLGLR